MKILSVARRPGSRLPFPAMRPACRVFRLWPIAGLVLWQLFSPAAFAQASTPEDQQPAAVEARLADTARYLSSDELQGRCLGSKELDLAAERIARSFREAGLQTDLFQGTCFQKFTVPFDVRLGADNRLVLLGPPAADGGKRPSFALNPGGDYTPLAVSGSGSFDLPLVFVGYGLSAPTLGYDDYAGMNVTGKTVIVLRHQPQQGGAGGKLARLSDVCGTTFRRKAAIAYEHGAAAVVFCTDQHDLRAQRRRSDSLVGFQTAGSECAHPDLPVLHCRRKVVDHALQAVCGTDLAKLEDDIDRSGRPQSRELPGWRLVGHTDIRHTPIPAQNIVAVLPGNGPNAEQTVILGAHYDHLGRGSHRLPQPARGPIYNGADDNASGVAVMLETARSLARRPLRPHRRIVFVAFSGEEWGCLGSSYYVNHPPLPLETTVAMINLDMVGRLRDNNVIIGGTNTSGGFAELVGRLNGRHGFRLTEPPGSAGPSDQKTFYCKNIPVMHFFTGRHDDYHSPRDKFATLNIAGMRRISGLLADVLAALAEAPGRPEYVAVLPERRGAAPRPYFGSVPDFTRTLAGCFVSAVMKDGPAERAGLHRGDVIVRLGDLRIGNADDFDDALRTHAAGERISVVVRRGSQSLTREVKLGPAR